ncbi:MAG: amidohydrolase family protein [Dehalococcoidia bacterium]
MADIVIKNGFILTLAPDRDVIEGGALAIEGDRIVGIGPAGEISRRHQATINIDARDKLVMPGLVNGHVHLGSTLSRGLLDDIECVPWIERIFSWYYPSLDEESYYLATMICCLEMVKTGTTTLCDCGTLPGVEGAAVRAVTEIGMRGVLGRVLMDIYQPPAILGVPENMQETTEEALSRGEEFVKRYHKAAGGRIQAWLDLQQVSNSSDELCRGVREITKRYDVGILTHAAVSPAEVRICPQRFGLPPIERFDNLGLLGPWFLAAHMGWINGGELILLKERRANVVHIAGSSMHGAYGSISRGLFPEMAAAGINICLGSDGASCSNHFDMVRQLYLAATAHKEVRLDPTLFPAQQVLRMGTINGARALGLEKEIGTLEVGKKADVAIFDLMRPEWVPFHRENLVSNLVYSASGASVDTVIIDGRLIVQNGQVKTVDEHEILKRGQKVSRRILDKADWLPRS